MAEPKPENLLEKAKLISDLAAAWQNKELADLMKSLPSGSKVFEIFSEAINREMAAVMSGKKDDAPQLQALSKQVDQMSSAMGGFRDLIVGFMQSPLVQVLDLMNKNLGARGHQFQQASRQPQPVAEEQDDQPVQPDRGSRGAPGLGSF